jgi:hypothetical protein
MKKLLVYCCLALFTSNSWGQSLDAESAAALQQTIALLTSQSERQALISANPAAENADQALGDLVNGDENQSEKIYALSASVMTAIVNSANGDLNQMNTILLELQSNPAAIANYLSPQDMADLQDVAKQLAAP